VSQYSPKPMGAAVASKTLALEWLLEDMDAKDNEGL
jgi:hypothetical protein